MRVSPAHSEASLLQRCQAPPAWAALLRSLAAGRRALTTPRPTWLHRSRCFAAFVRVL